MRYFILYLVAVAIAIGAIATATGALAHPLACDLGSYGKMQLQEQGRC